MNKLKQTDTPFIDAVKKYINEPIVPFDVPGHHMGGVKNRATELLGEHVFKCDINAPYGLDNLAKPNGVIRDMEQLLSEATKADYAFPLINGTSEGIIAMFLTALKAGDRVILPRNIHKSILNALILCGAIPIYIMPNIDYDLEIAHQPTIDEYKKAILKNSSAKAVFIINPTYFGAVGPLKELVDFAHLHGMAVLVDEAHGAHFYFYLENQPMTAMAAGADLSSVSFHKTGGSLTQSSVLLGHNGFFRREDAQKSLNIINSTSPSTLLLASIDGAREYMTSLRGKKRMQKIYEYGEYARKEINKIPGFKAVDKDYYLSQKAVDFDACKLVIGLDGLTIDGFSLYRLLRTKYHIQMELAETYAILAILATGTKEEHVKKLIAALKDISKDYYKKDLAYPIHHFEKSFPFMLARPREAFQAPGKVLPLEMLDGEVSKEQVMIYPPGIPFIAPGEVWTKDLIEHVKHYEKNRTTILSSYKDGFEVIDLPKWKRFHIFKRRLEDYIDNRKTLPMNDGYYLPFEGDKHHGTFVLLPFRKDTWRDDAVPARECFKDLITTIARFEPVYVGIHPDIYQEVAPEFSNLENVKPFPIRYNDAWARDILPLFVTNGKFLRTIDFRFNAWGGSYDGLYKNYKDDDHLAYVLSKRLKLLTYSHPSFVMEGGAITVDGEGTLIATEACLLSPGRNPSLTRNEIIDVLKEYLGVEKVILVPHGIYGDETDEHVDNMVQFVRPGEVIMADCHNTSDPQYEYSKMTYECLRKARDAKGRKLVIHKVPVPKTPLFMTETEALGLKHLRGTLDNRVAGRRLAASYINFYQGDNFVIVPQFGIPDDKKALAIFKEIFKDKEVVGVQSREILLGGGNIHCVTMQLPEVKNQKYEN